jgi:glycosyltransferase involved in cell wall biosynthesis
MHLSIVIPAWNEEKLLPATLQALHSACASFSAAGISWEVIVCDNNSTDRTAEVARTAGATVVFEPVNQISRARNTGAAAASGSWLLFLDADSTPSAPLMQELAATIARPDVLFGGCALVMDQPLPGAEFFIRQWHRLARWKHWAAGSFFFVRRDAFTESGGFSLEFFAAEELELSDRLKKIARRQNQHFVFLTNHPLVTSARKLAFRSPASHFWFMLKTALTGGRTLKRRESCDIWYDGRR